MSELDLPKIETPEVETQESLDLPPNAPAASSEIELPHEEPSRREASGKNEDKGIRQPVEGADKSTRLEELGYRKRMDAGKYLAMEEFKGKTIFWENQLDGAIDFWLDNGAEPIPSRSKTGRTFKGLNDAGPSQWVRALAGTDEGGNAFYAYLLMMDPKDYDLVKHAPIRRRQEAIKAALTKGVSQSGDQEETMPGGGTISTYAANLPDGGKGFSRSNE